MHEIKCFQPAKLKTAQQSKKEGKALFSTLSLFVLGIECPFSRGLGEIRNSLKT